MTRTIGVITAGGDTPGLNSALRALGKTVAKKGMHVIGFRDGFRGLMENRTMRLEGAVLSGLLNVGGTILGTSRDKPNRMPMGDKRLDMTEVMFSNYEKHHLNVLVCLGGGGTQKSALHLMNSGLNVLTIPKTIDNDIAHTDVTFGFDTALGIATEAIDRLHSTAHSHHRIILVETMGHNAGWLALGAGLAGGADVILIPEIPYDIQKVAAAIMARRRRGSNFSIVAISEGACSEDEKRALDEAKAQVAVAEGKEDHKRAKKRLRKVRASQQEHIRNLSRQLEKLTQLESRVTILGYVQRGGVPSAVDRLLTTQLGTVCGRLAAEGEYGKMIAIRGAGTCLVPLEDVVAGGRRTVPLDHPWMQSARDLDICLGDD